MCPGLDVGRAERPIRGFCEKFILNDVGSRYYYGGNDIMVQEVREYRPATDGCVRVDGASDHIHVRPKPLLRVINVSKVFNHAYSPTRGYSLELE